MTTACDVLVVGGGPVGMVLAARLVALGLEPLVVDRAAGPYGLPRAVAADDEVADLLELTAPGCLDGALVDVPVRLVGRDGSPLGRIDFPRGPSGRSGLSLFSQPLIEQRLDGRAPRRWGVGLAALVQDARGVTARLSDGSAVRCRYLVGCDGASSTVRRLVGAGWTGRDLGRWLVVDARGTVRPGLTYTCDPARPQVDMPTPGGHRWEWLLRDDEPVPSARQLLAREWVRVVGSDVGGPPDASPETAREPGAVTGSPPFWDGTVELVRSTTYRYGARQARHWQVGRVLLAGDAAHTMPPFAGQGLGAGVRDAVALAALLAADDPSGYQALRSPHVQAMTRLSLLLGAVVETRSPVVAACRDALLGGAFGAPLVGPWLRRGGPRPSASGVAAVAGHV